ncbi:B12-binding domain-containing radical SAM protein [Geomesophilobacter sediminis]|uniref:B12-binding domain-containing radical SAM protein n=1 Tax=Geomesophilobacter sediminis TaxID=2798584 RepID=A0A8J7IKX4_9BACT|nr:radical SAM protein [Geomesophilobacter sediminis]MBJ6723333.1 B12-binding domain-containing radical SAM protein [Geomesophilobacter sediminis]
MKILLVLPANHTLRVTTERPEVPQRKMLRFSLLPLTTVAALTPPEHEVAICDEHVQPLDFDCDVDMVGVSFMTALAPRAYEIAAEFSRRGKIVVAGGYHPTFLPDEASQHFNAVLVGDAEGLWPALVLDAVAGSLKKLYQHDALPQLDLSPAPRRELLRTTAQYYATTDAVQTARGCLHQCRYCSVTAFHNGSYRHRPVARVLEELREIGRDFIFVDDNIIADTPYAKELFQQMAPLRKRWVSQAAITIADDQELLRLARKAGCQGLFIGVETTNADNLAAVGKGFNDASSYAERIRKIKKAGIGVIAGIIVGMDDDRVGVFEKTLRFLQQTDVDAIQVNILTPLPGTPLFGDMEREGRILDRDWEHYDYRHVVFHPAKMTKRELQNGADWLYHEFYRLDRIIFRSIRAFFIHGPIQSLLSFRLNMTYRYDNRREQIIGRNPATAKQAGVRELVVN